MTSAYVSLGVIAAAVMVLWGYPGTQADCSAKRGVSDLKIPQGLDLSTFNSMIVNNLMGELYYAMNFETKYLPDVNYFSLITRESDTVYRLASVGDSVGTVPRCNTYSKYLYTETSTDTAEARFRIGNSTTTDVYFSSCPTDYVWFMQCRKPYGPKLKKCAVGDTFLGLFIIQQNKSLIPGDREFLNNLRFDKMVRDVCPTGMKFGLPDLKWYFSFGRTVNCAGQDVFSKYIP